MKTWLTLVTLVPILAWAKLPVVVSFSILADITQEIGGGRVEIVSLVGPDQDAHVFEPSPADVKKVATAKVLVLNGLGFEGWMVRLSKAAQFKGIQVNASQGIKPLTAVGHDHYPAGQDSRQLDPHAWQNPMNVQTYIRNITHGLIQADPAGKAEYEQRAAVYGQRVQALDRWAEQAFATIPPLKRKMLTSHDAFGYLGQRYHIKILALQSVSTASEASAKQIASFIRQIQQENVEAIFLENMSDKRLLEQVVREAKVRIAGKLYSDALSTQRGPASTYIKMFSHNVATIIQSLKSINYL